MIQLILLFHVLIAITIVGLVLIQQGKGAGLGSGFGGSSSQALFGSRGPASFLMKLTGSLAFLFFATSLGLGYMASAAQQAQKSLALPAIQQQAVPVSTQKKPSSADVPVLKKKIIQKVPKKSSK